MIRGKEMAFIIKGKLWSSDIPSPEQKGYDTCPIDGKETLFLGTCLCKSCVLGAKECVDHELLHPHYFDQKVDFFIVRNSDEYDINVNEGEITFSNSMDKVYKVINDQASMLSMHRCKFSPPGI